MSNINSVIQKLNLAGNTPNKICTLLKDRLSKSEVYKFIKCLKKTVSTNLTILSTPDSKKDPKINQKHFRKIKRKPHKSFKILAFEVGVVTEFFKSLFTFYFLL